MDFRELLDDVIAKKLREVGTEGWQPDGPTDRQALIDKGRLHYKLSQGLFMDREN
jgi:hypothetical protein